mmetsp:Transcript_21558/g.52399  ORF Transcript_21558/g.52399 Transcript_21558/m.52399 type:complete len:249 (+) Transcript_21558:2196-2942(+)
MVGGLCCNTGATLVGSRGLVASLGRRGGSMSCMRVALFESEGIPESMADPPARSLILGCWGLPVVLSPVPTRFVVPPLITVPDVPGRTPGTPSVSWGSLSRGGGCRSAGRGLKFPLCWPREELGGLINKSGFCASFSSRASSPPWRGLIIAMDVLSTPCAPPCTSCALTNHPPCSPRSPPYCSRSPWASPSHSSLSSSSPSRCCVCGSADASTVAPPSRDMVYQFLEDNGFVPVSCSVPTRATLADVS